MAQKLSTCVTPQTLVSVSVLSEMDAVHAQAG